MYLYGQLLADQGLSELVSSLFIESSLQVAGFSSPSGRSEAAFCNKLVVR
jgi:hypothetical protein